MNTIIEKTLCIVKPDAVRAQNAEEIMQLVELDGFHILEKRKIQLNQSHVMEFYAEHIGKPFFTQLLSFMTSGPLIALILAKHDAISAWRSLMGPTNSEVARETAPSTLRALYGTDGTQNAVHGSDSSTSAQREIKFFFPHREVGHVSDDSKPAIPKSLEDALCRGLTELAKQKPSQDPTAATIWLGDWLLQHNPNKPLVYGPDELALDDVDDGAEFAHYESERVEEPVQSQNSCQEDPPLPLQHTLAMIKPDAVAAGNAQAIMDKIEASGFKIVRRRYYRLYPAQAESFYAEHKGKNFFEGLMEFMTSGPIWALELEGEDGIKAWRTLMGPTNTIMATQEAPASLRAQFGTDGTRNATHGSDSMESAVREIDFHFPPVESTLAMIKPDAVAAGEADSIMDQIEQQGFKIVQKRSYQLSEEQAKDFYAEHVGKPFFPRLLEFMTSGPIWAITLELHGAIAAWRAMMGPTNSNVAKDTAPMTLRAQFGTDGTLNAVHGSDSPQAAEREIAFHFQSLKDAQPAVASGNQMVGDAMPHVATNEKSAAEMAEEDAAAVKIQEAVRDRQASQQEQHKQQEPVEGDDSPPRAGHEAGADKSGNQTITSAPDEAGEDGDGLAGLEEPDDVEEPADAGAGNAGAGDKTTAQGEDGDNSDAKAADPEPAFKEDDGGQDTTTSAAVEEASAVAEPETDNAVTNVRTMPENSDDMEGALGHEEADAPDDAAEQDRVVQPAEADAV